MAILHIIRCDGPRCGKEAPLVYFQARQIPVGLVSGASWSSNQMEPSYSPPSGWQKFDGKDLCSMSCVAAYATEKAQS